MDEPKGSCVRIGWVGEIDTNNDTMMKNKCLIQHICLVIQHEPWTKIWKWMKKKKSKQNCKWQTDSKHSFFYIYWHIRINRANMRFVYGWNSLLYVVSYSTRNFFFLAQWCLLDFLSHKERKKEKRLTHVLFLWFFLILCSIANELCSVFTIFRYSIFK